MFCVISFCFYQVCHTFIWEDLLNHYVEAMVFYCHSSTIEALQAELHNKNQSLVVKDEQIMSMEKSLIKQEEQIMSMELSLNKQQEQLRTMDQSLIKEEQKNRSMEESLNEKEHLIRCLEKDMLEKEARTRCMEQELIELKKETLELFASHDGNLEDAGGTRSCYVNWKIIVFVIFSIIVAKMLVQG